MASLKDMIERGKGRAYVPLSIREAGGLALSLWNTGANRTDCLLVAALEKRVEALENAVHEHRAGVLHGRVDAADADEVLWALALPSSDLTKEDR